MPLLPRAMDAVTKYICPRLVDYIAIVGARQPSASHSVHIPELLRRYPSEDHKDFPLPPDVVFFCQPEGCISVGPRRMSLRETNSFVFALTDKDSSRTRYGICVNFYRQVEKRSPSVTSHHKRREKQTADKTATSEDNVSSTSSPVPEKTIEDETLPAQENPEKVKESESKTKRRLKRQQSSYTNTLTSLCLISHHPFFSTFREFLLILKKFIETCSERNQSRKSPTSRHARK